MIEFRLMAVTLPLTILTILACESAASEADGTPVEFRSGTGVKIRSPADNATVGGDVCVTLAYDCEQTAEVIINIGTTEVFSWVRSENLFSDARIPPGSICFDSNRLTNDTHTLTATETCVDTSWSSDSIDITSTQADLFIIAVIPNDSEYQLGDTIQLMVHAGTSGMLVNPDFSALDSDFGSIAWPTVVDMLDGRYHVSYTISSRNTRDAGEYDVPITISTSTSTRIYEQGTRLTYVPNGRGRVVAAGAGLRNLGDVPPSSSGTDAPALVTNSLTLSGTPPPTGGNIQYAAGETFTLSGEFSAPEDRVRADFVHLLLSETGRDGYDQVLTPAVSTGCSAGICEFEFEAELMIDLEARMADTIDWQVGIMLTDHGANPISPLIPGPGLSVKAPTPPPTGEFEVWGHVSLLYRHQLAAYSAFHMDQHPQYGFTKRPPAAKRRIRHTRIRLDDGCSGSHQGWTDANGNFLFQYDTACPNSEAVISIVSESDPGALDLAVLDTNGSLHTVAIARFVPASNPSSYQIETLDVGLDPIAPIDPLTPQFVPVAAAPFNLLDYGVAAQLWTRYILLGPTPYNGYDMPFLGIRYERNHSHLHTSYTCGSDDVANDHGSCQLGSGIYIASGQNNRDEWELTTFLHEYTHYLDDHFMVSDPVYTIWNETKPQWMFAFDEGIAYGMSAVLTGKPWDIRERGSDFAPTVTAESYDFNGVVEIDQDSGDYIRIQAHMPEDGNYSSGWVARIVWDLADPTSLEYSDFDSGFYACDPVINADNKWESCQPLNPFGEFDEIDGGFSVLMSDVLFNYLGDGLIPANPALGDITTNGRGPFEEVNEQAVYGTDLIDLLDGVVCRGHGDVTNLGTLINTVMAFSYEWDGPTSCP